MIDGLTAAVAPLAERVAPGASLLSVWELKGGISAQTIAFELRHSNGNTERCVARCLPTGGDLRNDLDSEGEFRLLGTLYKAGVPVPRPLLHEPWNERLRAAVLVLEFVDGSFAIDQREMPSLLAEFAAHLAVIHRVDWRRLGLSFLPDRFATWERRLFPRPTALDESLGEGAIREVLEAAWPVASTRPPVLLHGDFWPGNVLWHDDRLAAIIDWEDAAIGDPLSDVAITRLELLWRFDMAAADAFAEQYRALTGVDLSDLPLWDLFAALRPAGVIDGWGSTPAAVARMRAKHHEFVRRAMDALKSRA